MPGLYDVKCITRVLILASNITALDYNILKKDIATILCSHIEKQVYSGNSQITKIRHYITDYECCNPGIQTFYTTTYS